MVFRYFFDPESVIIWTRRRFAVLRKGGDFAGSATPFIFKIPFNGFFTVARLFVGGATVFDAGCGA